MYPHIKDNKNKLHYIYSDYVNNLLDVGYQLNEILINVEYSQPQKLILHKELNEYIMLFVDDNSLFKMMQVSQEFYKIAKQEKFWKLRLNKLYHFDVDMLSYKDIYAKITDIHFLIHNPRVVINVVNVKIHLRKILFERIKNNINHYDNIYYQSADFPYVCYTIDKNINAIINSINNICLLLKKPFIKNRLYSDCINFGYNKLTFDYYVP
jgi:hypothetical protein